MTDSRNAPANANWRYSKSWLSVKKLDEQRYLFMLSCAWADSPKAQCNDWFTLHLRGGQLFMQDESAPVIQITFDAASRKLGIISEGVNGNKRIDSYAPAEGAGPLDTDLARRLKAAGKSWDAAKNARYFARLGHTRPVLTLP